MKKLFLLPTILLVFNSSFAQKPGPDVKTEIILAKTVGPELNLKDLFNSPVLSSPSTPEVIGRFELSWVTVSDQSHDQTFEGPYIIRGNTVNGVALLQLKADAAHGRITKMFVEKVQVIAADGTMTSIKAAKAYKVVKS